jgi:polysaccharide pyruvyl transferase WcaK-like protein
VVYQTSYTTHQSVSAQTRNALISLIGALSRDFDVHVICNYIDEMAEASALFGSDRVRYSYDSVDYADFFADVDCVIGARVHACLGAMGVGTPALLIDWEKDSRRKGIAEQIPLLTLAHIDDPASIAKTIAELDVSQRSAEILQWREAVRAQYSQRIATCTRLKKQPEPAPSAARVNADQILSSNERRHRQATRQGHGLISKVRRRISAGFAR